MKKDNKTSDNFSNIMEFRDYLTRLEESDRLEGWTDDTPKKTVDFFPRLNPVPDGDQKLQLPHLSDTIWI